MKKVWKYFFEQKWEEIKELAKKFFECIGGAIVIGAIFIASIYVLGLLHWGLSLLFHFNGFWFW